MMPRNRTAPPAPTRDRARAPETRPIEPIRTVGRCRGTRLAGNAAAEVKSQNLKYVTILVWTLIRVARVWLCRVVDVLISRSSTVERRTSRTRRVRRLTYAILVSLRHGS